MWWFVAPYFSGRFTWGFDILKYHSPGFRLVWLLSGLLLLTAVNYIPLPRKTEYLQARPAVLLSLLLPAGVILFFLMRVRIPLLGDGILRSQEISAGRLFSFTEPLTTLIHGLLYRFLSVFNLQVSTAQLSYRILSAAGGAAALFLYYSYAKEQDDRQAFWPVFIILFGAGFNQIFYGYIESYALFLAALGWYLFLTRKKISDPGPSYVPALLAGTAVALHGSGIFLFPSLIYYWKSKSYFSTKDGWKRLVPELLSFSAVPAAALAAGLMLVSRPEINTSLSELPKRSLLPLWGGLWGYGILSPGHWLDIFNQLLLAAPVSILLFLGSRPGNGSVKNPAGRFLCLAAAGGFLFLSIADPKLGTARDWDLLAWPVVALFFFLLHRALKEDIERRGRAVAAVVSLWLLGPWVMVNASAEKSLARYTDLLASDKRSAAYGYENLAIYYRDHRHSEQEEWAYRMAMESDSLNPRNIYNYALSLSKNGRYRRSLAYFQRSLQLEAQSAKRWNDYGAALINCQMPGPAIDALKQALEADPGNGSALYNMGVVHSMLGEWAAADSFFGLTQQASYSDAWLYYYWGEVKFNLKQYHQAVRYLKTAIDSGIRERELFDAYQKALAAMPESDK